VQFQHQNKKLKKKKKIFSFKVAIWAQTCLGEDSCRLGKQKGIKVEKKMNSLMFDVIVMYI